MTHGERDISPSPPPPEVYLLLPSLCILTLLILPLPLPLPPPLLAGPPAANNRPNNPSSHPQTHPGRAPSQGERRQTEENYRGPVCRRAPWTPAPSWAVHGWNVGNSFWRHAPHHHLPGGPTTLCCICHLETEIRGGVGDQSGWNWRGGGDHRGEFPLCPLISQLSRPTSISSRFGRKPSHCHRPPSCQTHISPSSPLQINLSRKPSAFTLLSTTTPCQTFIATLTRHLNIWW